MSRQPFLALRDVHVVCCHPQEPVADLDIIFVIRPVSKFSSAYWGAGRCDAESRMP
jgi:hypothetical protein